MTSGHMAVVVVVKVVLLTDRGNGQKEKKKSIVE